MRLHYRSDGYISLARVARHYRHLLATRCELVEHPAQADVVLLHLDMRALAAALGVRRRGRRPYRIGYLVWETDALPENFAAAVAQLDEVWTPSAYCFALFARYHPKVRYLPHVIDPPLGIPRRAAWDFFADRLHLTPGSFYFLTVTRQADPRKNDAELRRAVLYAQRREPRLHLVVKTLTDRALRRRHWQVTCHGPTTVLDAPLPDDAMAALYRLADAYVSAHHSEAWGLPLADALAAGLPVVAPAYSGNLDFMTRHNSLLVAADEAPVGPAAAARQFLPEMRWGWPHRESLERQILRAYRGSCDGSLQATCHAAARDAQHFAAAHVAAQLDRLLEAVRLSL